MDEHEKETRRQERKEQLIDNLMLIGLIIAVALAFFALVLIIFLVAELTKNVSLVQKITAMLIVGAAVFQFLNVIRK